MNIIQKTCTAAAGAMLVMMSTIAPVAADGYWVDGYWDDASQTWIEGRWVETGGGQQSWNGGWSAGPYQEYANGAVINYDANGNRTSTVVTNVPVYSQRNGAWAGVTIGSGGNFGSTGCVPTALAVIMNHFGIGGSPLDFGYTLNAYGNYNSAYGHGTDSGGLLNVGAGTDSVYGHSPIMTPCTMNCPAASWLRHASEATLLTPTAWFSMVLTQTATQLFLTRWATATAQTLPVLLTTCPTIRLTGQPADRSYPSATSGNDQFLLRCGSVRIFFCSVIVH